MIAYNDSVVPSKDSEIIEPGNQIPPRSDVACYEDRKSEDRERVHESISMPATLLRSRCIGVEGKVCVAARELVLFSGREMEGSCRKCVSVRRIPHIRLATTQSVDSQ